MSLRKVFSIIMMSLALLGFIFTFIGYADNGYSTPNLWNMSKSWGFFMLLGYAAIITLYALHLSGVFKTEKWITYANYAVGFVTFWHLSFLLFSEFDGAGVGLWLNTIFGIALAAISVVWYFVSDEPFKKGNGAPVTGFDPKTGKPIYAKQKGFDPKTGKPIYED